MIKIKFKVNEIEGVLRVNLKVDMEIEAEDDEKLEQKLEEIFERFTESLNTGDQFYWEMYDYDTTNIDFQEIDEEED